MISDYLMRNYYAHYKGNRLDVVPTREQINQAILNHPEKLIIVRDGGIKGIAFFVTLSDETYQRLETLDITQIPVIQALAVETGRNFHFLLLTADSYKTIRLGLKRIKKLNPKTVSWFSPDMKRLHKYEVR